MKLNLARIKTLESTYGIHSMNCKIIQTLIDSLLLNRELTQHNGVNIGGIDIKEATCDQIAYNTLVDLGILVIDDE